MVISDKYKCIYIHIPKTGGTSIAYGTNIFSVTNQSTHELAKLLQKRLPKETFESYFKFSFIRNPLDWFVSSYFYFKQMTHKYKWYEANKKVVQEIQGLRNFEEFCLKIDYLSCFHVKSMEMNHFRPQHEYLTDDKGRLLVNYLGRFETLSKSWEDVCRFCQIPFTELPVLNSSAHDQFEKYYTSKTKDIVLQYYSKDYELFQSGSAIGRILGV